MRKNEHLTNTMVYPNFFDEDKITHCLSNSTYLGPGIPVQIRTCSIYVINDNDDIVKYINEFIKKINNKFYNFDIVDIDGEDIPKRFEYTSAENGKFDEHLDIGSNPQSSTRKISYSIQLTDGDEYEGGDLVFWPKSTYNSPELRKMRRQKGSIIFFPSYMVHAVTPVTKGVRNALVGWVNGNPFR